MSAARRLVRRRRAAELQGEPRTVAQALARHARRVESWESVTLEVAPGDELRCPFCRVLIDVLETEDDDTVGFEHHAPQCRDFLALW